MLRNSGWFTVHLLVQRGPHPMSVAGIHRHSTSSTPHLDLAHGCWESDANQEFHQLIPIWSLSPIYRFCAGIYTVTGTPWFNAVPLCAIGHRTRQIQHLTLLPYLTGNRPSSCKDPCTQCFSGKRKVFLGSLTTALGNVIEVPAFS